VSEFQPGEWSYRKCPAPQIAVAENDKGSLWLVQFDDREGRWKGEIAITQGKHSRAHAQLFAASLDLLTAATALSPVLEALCDWDDGCLYVNGTACTELAEPMRLLKDAIAKANSTPAPACHDDANRTFDDPFDARHSSMF